MEETLIPINVVVGDRTYRVRIEPGDEEAVRKTVKIINDKLVEFKTAFAGKDMQDYLAMVLIWFATEQTAGISRQMNMVDLTSRLENIEKLIDATMKDEA